MITRSPIFAPVRVLVRAALAVTIALFASGIGAQPKSTVSTGTVQAPIRNTGSGPTWVELTPMQRQALGPLAPDWDKLELTRKRKWIEVANRFPAMKPAEQARTQERMREWVRMTPEQRGIARDSYARAQALPPEKRAELLRQYQQLPEEKKKQLAAESKSARSLTPVRPPATSGAKPAAPFKAQIREAAEHPVPSAPAAAVRPGTHVEVKTTSPTAPIPAQVPAPASAVPAPVQTAPTTAVSAPAPVVPAPSSGPPEPLRN